MRTTSTIAAAVAVLGTLTAALGAVDGFESPPLTPGVNWAAYLFSLVFVAAIAVVGFKTSKRTHLD